MKQPVLIAMQASRMWRVHPQTDYTHSCARCGALLGLYPSGQKILREHPEIEIICDVCAHKIPGEFDLQLLPEVFREAAESVPIHKKKPQ